METTPVDVVPDPADAPLEPATPDPEEQLLEILTVASRAVQQITLQMFKTDPRRALHLSHDLQSHLLDCMDLLEPRPDKRYRKRERDDNGFGIGNNNLIGGPLGGDPITNFSRTFEDLMEKVLTMQNQPKVRPRTPSDRLDDLRQALHAAQEANDTARVAALQAEIGAQIDRVLDDPAPGSSALAPLPPTPTEQVLRRRVPAPTDDPNPPF